MRVFIAGATGAIGQQLVPQLLDAGHDVIAMSRSTRRTRAPDELGARSVTGDALDRTQLMRLVAEAKPDAVVNLLTALPPSIDPKHIDRDMAATNRLRTDGARNLFDAATEAGVEHCVVESIAYVIDPSGPAVTDEAAPLWQSPPKRFAASVDAVAAMEQLASENGASVLRFGHLYGPGTTYDRGGAFTAQVLSGKVPLVGDGGSVFSFVHSADAAAAVVAVLQENISGVVNVVDDEPAPMSMWLPEFARLVGAGAPKRIPRWLARLAVGEYGVAWMTALRGSSNRRANELLGWKPRRATWREGFRESFYDSSAAR